MSHEFAKKTTIMNVIKNSVVKVMNVDQTVSEERLINACIVDYQTSWAEVVFILKEMERDKFIVRERGCIWTPKAYDAEQTLNRIKMGN